MYLRSLLIATLLAVIASKRQLKILVYSPSIGFSHMQFQGKLADLLVEAGHEVVSSTLKAVYWPV